MAHNRLMVATRRAIWILAASGAAIGLAGCGNDPANDAVQAAAQEINTLSLGGANPTPSVEIRVTAYNQIVSRLTPHANAETPATAAAANMLIARAQAGLAAVEVSEFAAAEAAAQRLMESLSIHLDSYIAHQAQVAALEAYNPAPALADLDNQIKTKDAEIEQAWNAKAELDAFLADLEAKAEAASSRASQERQKETALRQQAINAKAVEQAELITQANEHKRAADAHDKEASLVRAQAAQRAPEGVALQSAVDRFTDQRKLLEDAKAEIRAFAKTNTDRAAAARADAMAAAEQIRQTEAELAKVRADLPDAAEKAASTFDKAISAARSASRGGGAVASNASIATAVNQHAKADLLSLQVRGLRSYAAMLNALADATPPLPESASYRSKAAAATEKAEELTKEAVELLSEAQDAYANSGGRGESADQFSRLAASMEQLTGKAAGDASAGSEEVASDGGDVDAPAGDAEAEIRAMLERLVDAIAAQDVATMLSMVEFSPPEAGRFIGALTDLEAACKEKFGKSLTEVMSEAMGGAGGPSIADMGAQMFAGETPSVDDAVIVVDGPDSATITSREDPDSEPVKVARIDGQWKFQHELPPGEAEEVAPMTAVFEKLAADIRSGAIATPAQFGPAMMQQMMQLQQQGGG